MLFRKVVAFRQFRTVGPFTGDPVVTQYTQQGRAACIVGMEGKVESTLLSYLKFSSKLLRHC